MKTKIRIAAYLALVSMALVIAAGVWELIAPGRWFYCDDSIGFSFIPPFAHTDVATYGQSGDRYMADSSFVYAVWGSFIGIALLLPAFVVFGVPRFRKQLNT